MLEGKATAIVPSVVVAISFFCRVEAFWDIVAGGHLLLAEEPLSYGAKLLRGGVGAFFVFAAADVPI